MSDQTIFGTQNNQADPATQTNQGSPAAPNTQQNANPFADLLNGIRNESGSPKYGTVEDALKGAAHAQAFIDQLKREKAELQAERDRLAGVADKTTELERTVQELIQKSQERTQTGETLTPEQIAELVTRTLTEKETHKSAQENLNTVVSTLQREFGADAEQKFYAKAQELGMTKAEINQLAASKPKAVLTMLGVSGQPAQKQGTTAPQSGSVNTAAFQPKQDSFVGRNKEIVSVGATASELQREAFRAKAMVEELHEQGMSVHDLSDPKIYNKLFG